MTVIVHELRSKLGLSQESFARLLRVSFSSVNRWETGKNVPTGLSLVLLVLLSDAIEKAGENVVKELLSEKPVDDVELVRVLVGLGT